MLPRTPWHHTRHWVDNVAAVSTNRPVGNGDSLMRTNGAVTTGPVPAEWFCELVLASPSAVGSRHRRRQFVAGDRSSGNRVQNSGVISATRHGWRCCRRRPSPKTHCVRRSPGPPTSFTHRRYRPGISKPTADTPSSTRRARLTLAAAASAGRPRLHFLTRNAQPVSEGDRGNPAHAVLWGLGRTLALEHPEIWGGVVDVDEAVPDALAARYVIDEAHAGDGDDQAVYRAGRRHVAAAAAGLTPPQPRRLLVTQTAAIS